MNWLLYALCLVAGYLVGNFQTSILISTAYFKDDVRNHGSRNAGTTNMLRVFGIKPGVLTFLGDFIKGVIAVLIGRAILGEVGGYIAGLGAVLGHDFPVLFGFKGGKGVATTLAIAWLSHPLLAAIATVLAFAIIYFSEMVSVGSMLGFTLFMILTLIFAHSDLVFVVLCVVLWLLIIVRHADNIGRIIKGSENKLFKHK